VVDEWEVRGVEYYKDVERALCGDSDNSLREAFFYSLALCLRQ
jgi:hypothetical protein